MHIFIIVSNEHNLPYYDKRCSGFVSTLNWYTQFEAASMLIRDGSIYSYVGFAYHVNLHEKQMGQRIIVSVRNEKSALSQPTIRVLSLRNDVRKSSVHSLDILDENI